MLIYVGDALKQLDVIMMMSYEGHHVSIHRPLSCLFNSYADPHQRNIKIRITAPLWEEFTGDGDLPAQRASKAENASIWWRYHVFLGSNYQTTIEARKPLTKIKLFIVLDAVIMLSI